MPQEALAAPIHALLDKLVEGVRQNLIMDEELRKLARELLLSELNRLAIAKETDVPKKRKALFAAANKMAGAHNELDSQQASLKLNAFLRPSHFVDASQVEQFSYTMTFTGYA